jgi:U6 snRNA-associated Sm-like protein LSm8
LRWRRREKGEREKKKRKNRYSVLVDVVVDRRKNSTSTTSSKSFSFPQTNTAAITVICNDGRVIAGTLRGFDQAVNLILSDCVERVFSADAGTELQPLGGLHVIRGDNVAVVGEIDADKEEGADWGSKRAAPLPPVTH